MEYQPLGRTGVQVSELCLGIMSFGGDADEEEASARMYSESRDASIQFVDTANTRSAGEAERVPCRFAGEGSLGSSGIGMMEIANEEPSTSWRSPPGSARSGVRTVCYAAGGIRDDIGGISVSMRRGAERC